MKIFILCTKFQVDREVWELAGEASGWIFVKWEVEYGNRGKRLEVTGKYSKWQDGMVSGIKIT